MVLTTKRKRGPAVTLATLQQEIRAIQRASGGGRLEGWNWRKLDVKVQPMMGLGLFALGLGLPMVVGAFVRESRLQGGSELLAGSLIVFLGLQSIGLCITLQNYFVRHPASLPSFLSAIEKDPKKEELDSMKSWAEQQGERARVVKVAVRQLQFVLWTGAIATGLAFGAMIALALALLALISVLLYAHAPTATIAYGAAAILLGILAFWFRRRRRRRTRGA